LLVCGAGVASFTGAEGAVEDARAAQHFEGRTAGGGQFRGGIRVAPGAKPWRAYMGQDFAGAWGSTAWVPRACGPRGELR